MRPAKLDLDIVFERLLVDEKHRGRPLHTQAKTPFCGSSIARLANISGHKETLQMSGTSSIR
jgi:hypothetical protein